MKVELTKKELRAIMDCINITERSLRGETLLSFMSPTEVVRRLGKIDLPVLWDKFCSLER